MLGDCNHVILSRSNDASQDMQLLEPLTYISQIPGKNIRTKLARAFNVWLKIPEEKVNKIEEIIQILHNSSLLIDDIEDNSILRRGVPVAHSIYGIPSTINASNYAQVIAQERALELHHPEVSKIYIEQLLELHRGQGMEIYWRDNYRCPTEDEYKEIIVKKTGGLFMLAIRLMQLFSDNKDDYTKLTSLIGLYFQIRDDFVNLKSGDYMMHKSYCEDLTEGKFSFPLIHAINTFPEDKRIMYILKQRTKDVEVKKYCISILEKMGSFEYTRRVLNDLQAEVKEEIIRLGGNPYMDQVMEVLLKIE